MTRLGLKYLSVSSFRFRIDITNCFKFVPFS